MTPLQARNVSGLICTPCKLFAGLLSEDLIFEDPFVESVGPESWIDYTTVHR